MKFRHLTAIVILILLHVVLTQDSPAIAQVTPSIRLIGLIGFDPTAGKHLHTTEFNWPDNRRVAAIVRFETAGYEQRKSVEVFWEISNSEGRQISKHSEAFQLHAGKHEVSLPVVFNLDEMFGTSQFSYRVELKLVGGERLVNNEEFVLRGPKMPEINFDKLRIRAVEYQGDDETLGPGDMFEFTGSLKIEGNSSGRLPSLVIWALMADDTLADDPWDEDPFSDLYWDWAQLASANGDWRFRVVGRLPLKFIEGGATDRPFEIFAVLSFGEYSISRSSTSAMVSGIDGTEWISSHLDDRLITIGRNWEWEIEQAGNTTVITTGDSPQWPGQK